MTLKLYTRHLPGFGYIVEKDGKRIATRPYDRSDASSITTARDEAEAIRARVFEKPSALVLLTA